MPSTFDDAFQSLERLNFSVNEAKAYLALLRLGPSLAGRIAKEARLDRSSAYNALKQLIERGIVSTIHENKRTVFVPSDPKKILDYFKEKEDFAQKIIPKLREQFAIKKEDKQVKLFQGFKGLKTVFQDIIDSHKEGDTLRVLGSEGQFSQSMPHYSPIFRKRKEQARIKTKMLIREGREKTTKGKLTEYKRVPSDVESPATINIYEGKVAIFIWEDTPEAILIENEKVARTLQNYFEFMWSNAKR